MYRLSPLFVFIEFSTPTINTFAIWAVLNSVQTNINFLLKYKCLWGQFLQCGSLLVPDVLREEKCPCCTILFS